MQWDAGALSQALQEYEEARSCQQDEELFTDIFGTYAAVVGLAGGPGGAAGLRGLAGGLSWTVRMAGVSLDQARTSRWFLPCCIQDMEMELDPADGVIAYEDAAANQLGVESVEVTVASEGVELDRGAMRRVVRRLVDEEGMAPALEDYYEKVREDLLDDDADVMTALDDWVDRVSGTELVFYWEDIELADASPRLWLEPELDTFTGAGEPILAEAGGGMIDPYEFHLVTPPAFERDDTILRMRPDPDRFPQSPWTTLSAASEQISLNRIEVEFEPSSHTGVEAGENVTFTVTVDNADDTGLQAPEIDGVGDAEFTEKDSDSGVYQLRYQAPDSLPEEPGITEIHTFATTRQGIRASDDAPPRHGTGFVSFATTNEDDDEEPDPDDEYTGSMCGPRPVGETVEYHRGEYWVSANSSTTSGELRMIVGADTLEVFDPGNPGGVRTTYELLEVSTGTTVNNNRIGRERENAPSIVNGLLYSWGNPDGETLEHQMRMENLWDTRPITGLTTWYYPDPVHAGWCWITMQWVHDKTPSDGEWGEQLWFPALPPSDNVHMIGPIVGGEPPP